MSKSAASSGKAKISLAPVTAFPNPPEDMPATPLHRAPAAVTAAAPSRHAAPTVKVVPPSTIVAALGPRSTAAMNQLGDALAQQGLSVARTFGALQAKALDFGVSKLEADLADVETLANVASIAEAVIIQAKAFRREQEAWVRFLTDCANTLAESARPR